MTFSSYISDCTLLVSEDLKIFGAKENFQKSPEIRKSNNA
jgi:hypothetical protein